MMLPHVWLKRAKRMYLNGIDPALPSVSPINGDFTGAPPSLILVGAQEILRDDARGMAARLRGDGAEAALIEEDDGAAYLADPPWPQPGSRCRNRSHRAICAAAIQRVQHVTGE